MVDKVGQRNNKVDSGGKKQTKAEKAETGGQKQSRPDNSE